MDGIDAYELFEVRLLVFLETSPQSNTYKQVLLSAEHFKNVSDAVAGQFIRMDGIYEEVTARLSEDTYPLPDDLRSINRGDTI